MKRSLGVLISALLVAAALAFAGAGPASATSVSVRGHNAFLRAGCQAYPIDHRITLNNASNDWFMDYDVHGPKGWAGGEVLMNGEPTTGRKYTQICDEFDGPGTYRITWEFKEYDSNYNIVGAGTGTSSFKISRKPVAKLSLAGTTIRKASGNRAVIKVKSTSKVSGKAIRGRKLAFYLPNDGLEWNRRGSTKATNSRGVARKKVVWRWGQLEMPNTIPLRVCLSGTGSYSGSCVVKNFKVKR